MYEYKAQILKVTDGDTFHARVDLGFYAAMTLKFRLVGIDTAEIYSPSNEKEKAHGLAAKALAESLIGGKEVILRSYKNKESVYNRWEADITLPDGKTLSVTLLENGMQKKASYE